MEENKNQQNTVNSRSERSRTEDEKTLIDSLSERSRTEDEKTLVETETVNENGETVKSKNTISRKAALLAGGGVLLAGTALGATLSSNKYAEIQFDNNNDGTADTIISDSNQDGIYETEQKIETTNTTNNAEADASKAGVSVSEAEHWDPHTAPMASEETVNDEMSFSQAFASARQELGAGGVFEWHGQYYGTFYENEMNDKFQPTIEYATVEKHDLPTIAYEPQIEEVNEEILVTVSEETEIEITDLDFDGDGFSDAIYVQEDITTTIVEETVVDDVTTEVEISQVVETNEYLVDTDDYMNDLNSDMV